MLQIFNIREKQEYLREVAELTQKEWGIKTSSKKEFEEKINKKISKIINNFFINQNNIIFHHYLSFLNIWHQIFHNN